MAFIQQGQSKSSRWLNDKPKRPGQFQWQVGYGAFTVSVSQLDAVRTYVQNQEQHHRCKTFQDEFRKLLEKHKIAYDERYIWDCMGEIRANSFNTENGSRREAAQECSPGS